MRGDLGGFCKPRYVHEYKPDLKCVRKGQRPEIFVDMSSEPIVRCSAPTICFGALNCQIHQRKIEILFGVVRDTVHLEVIGMI